MNGLGLSQTATAAIEAIQICCDFPLLLLLPALFSGEQSRAQGFLAVPPHLHSKRLTQCKSFPGLSPPRLETFCGPAGSGLSLGGGWCSRRPHLPPGPRRAARWACVRARARTREYTGAQQKSLQQKSLQSTGASRKKNRIKERKERKPVPLGPGFLIVFDPPGAGQRRSGQRPLLALGLGKTVFSPFGRREVRDLQARVAAALGTCREENSGGGGLRGQLVADRLGLASELRAAGGPELRGAARRGAVVYVFLGRPADRGLVFAGRAQRWWLQVAAAAAASALSAARARRGDRRAGRPPGQRGIGHVSAHLGCTSVEPKGRFAGTIQTAILILRVTVPGQLSGGSASVRSLGSVCVCVCMCVCRVGLPPAPPVFPSSNALGMRIRGWK
ncbi:hypothetical protein HPG69_003055 [Diceros bicornis minor]|uniref:Uncharacterized protein n=1 Tax=Diceros bicornis minor TaxID=77932 RepID=A0A7J7EJJ3_DICBM|nr:hypothetical protein HPG69_003055 [Diceros bicornis minor]